ncbi:MAG: DUF2183 domain-containing protein [Burkholderiales bacterium]|nr:DUF2183 domain-containing protein [Anaerolineae bacterium]
MISWREVIAHVATDIENHYDHLKARLNERMGWEDPIHIVPYLGHGTREWLYLRGRVLEDKGITDPKDDDTIWLNLLNMYKRYSTDEIADARLRATFGDISQEVVTDEEGYFEFKLMLDPKVPLPEGQVWLPIELELLSYPGPQVVSGVKATGKVIVPPIDAQFGVISDIDDTVLQSHVLNLVALARNTFLRNARTRLPFEGVSAFYQALQKGTAGTLNPIYYLSSSAWNLYDLLVEFFEVRGIPAGPLFLVDIGLDKDHLFTPGHLEHKLKHVQMLLDTHPKLPFILIGDSGQKDPEIYLQAAVENPGRISAIYIRDVSGEERNKQITGYGDQAREVKTELIFVKDTLAASQHALAHGFILPETIPAVAEERAEDKKEPTPVEKLIGGEGTNE